MKEVIRPGSIHSIDGKVLSMLRLFHPKHKDATIVENHLNPVMLVFIR